MGSATGPYWESEDDALPCSQSSVSSLHFVGDDDLENGHEDYKVFNDPIHGHILVHPLLVKIIDTPQFQRLRNIKQVGTTYFVYPGASHNRFEHCIGTSHLAGKLARLLQEKQRNLGITDEDVLCVEMAGLCHDLGHGPYSHMFDGKFLKAVRPTCDWTHERGSCMMLDFLLENNNLWPELKKYGLSDTDVVFVKEMIAGPLEYKNDTEPDETWPYVGRSKTKSFLYEIVSNNRNKVDVDKWDYFARDCHHLGICNSFDHSRFMQFMMVLKVEGEHLQLCARDKECFNLYEMFNTRSVLHRRAYQHRVCEAIDIMLCDALVLADPHIEILGRNDRRFRMSESVDDPAAYTKLTDDIFNQILYSTKDALEPSRVLLNRILRRKLYQSIGAVKFGRGFGNSEAASILQQIVNFDQEHGLKIDDLAYVKRDVSYGMGGRNPIDSFKFFSKENPTKPYHIRKEDVSSMLPHVFQERDLEIFCKVDEKVTIGRQCFEEWCSKYNMQPKEGVLTPLKSKTNHINHKKRKLTLE